MRTTLDIDPDVLSAARELARRRGVAIGRVLSDLARPGAAERFRAGVVGTGRIDRRQAPILGPGP